MAKPERTLTNVGTAAAGYLFGSHWHIDWSVFLSLVLGSTLVIASACVFNNYFDRNLDKKMERTKNRALAASQIKTENAIICGLSLAILGFFVLSFINWLTIAVIAIGYIFYVFIYDYAKRRTVYSTLIGTIPGGAPIVAGYTAATNNLDSAALFLFLIMLSWQMIHFYAIGVFRIKDYSSAGMPIMPTVAGIRSTKFQMLAYALLFIFVSTMLTIFGYSGYIYLILVLLLGSIWLVQILQGFKTRNNQVWARDVFKFSLVVILVMPALISISSVLP